MRKGGMNHGSVNPRPVLGVVAIHHDYVRGNAKVAQLSEQAYRLPSLVFDMRLYNEEINVAVRTCFPTSMRAKENHLCSRSSGSETMSRLCDQ